MTQIRAVLTQLAGLFVDDGRFAVSILAWPAVIWLSLHLGLPSGWAAPGLFAGLAVILVDSAARRARR